jgi:hypothetical protein
MFIWTDDPFPQFPCQSLRYFESSKLWNTAEDMRIRKRESSIHRWDNFGIHKSMIHIFSLSSSISHDMMSNMCSASHVWSNRERMINSYIWHEWLNTDDFFTMQSVHQAIVWGMIAPVSILVLVLRLIFIVMLVDVHESAAASGWMKLFWRD